MLVHTYNRNHNYKINERDQKISKSKGVCNRILINTTIEFHKEQGLCHKVTIAIKVRN